MRPAANAPLTRAAPSTENPLGLSVRGLKCVSSSAFADRVAAASRVRREPGRGRHRREHSKREAGSEQPAQVRSGEHFRHLLFLGRSWTRGSEDSLTGR